MTRTPLEQHREANGDAGALTALGDEPSDLLVAYKSDEWARFCGAVTDWEVQMYTEAAP
jgi:glutamine synthetase